MRNSNSAAPGTERTLRRKRRVGPDSSASSPIRLTSASSDAWWIRRVASSLHPTRAPKLSRNVRISASASTLNVVTRRFRREAVNSTKAERMSAVSPPEVMPLPNISTKKGFIWLVKRPPL